MRVAEVKTFLSRILRQSERMIPERKIAHPSREMMQGNHNQPEESAGSAQSLDVEAEYIRRKQELAQIEQDMLSLVEKAQQQAVQLVEQAQNESIAIRANAEQAGFEQGLALGLQEARMSEQTVIDQINSLLTLAQTERRDRVKKSESFIVELALLVAKRLVRRELDVASSEYAAIFAQDLLRDVDKAHQVEIRVASSDFASVLDKRERMERMLTQTSECSIVIDQTLQSGDVVIRTDQGTVDGRLDIRFDQVRQILLRIAKEWEADENDRSAIT